MSEEQIKIIEFFYGVAIILIRGIFFYALVELFIKEEILDKKKNIILSAIITAEGLFLYAIPASTKGLFSIISLLTILAIFYFYDKKTLPHIIFVFFLWQNVHYVWHLINTATFDGITDFVLKSIDYGKEGAIEELWFRMFLIMLAQVVSVTVTLLIDYFLIKKICQKQYDMSWTEAVYLSIYSAISFFISYMIVDVMIVPLKDEVFVLFDEKRNLRFTLPILAVLILIGELSAIATWQRYRRLKEEDLLLQRQIKEQEFIQKKIEYTEEYHEKIRELRHDMAGKLTILKSFIDNEQYSDASSFLTEMDIELNAGGFKYVTGNPVTDVILNENAWAAEKLGCRLEIDFSFPKNNKISALDIGVILSNLLDNAIDGVSKVICSERYIKLLGEEKDNFYLIKVENSFDGTIKKDKDNHILSGKNDEFDNSMHGIGLKSVNNIAEKYLGGVKIQSENNVFIITVMLQAM